MTARGNGGIIGNNAPVTNQGGPGIWSIDDAYLLTLNNQWPVYNHNITGGTVTTITESGTTYKVHTFTTPGVLTVTSLGYGAPDKMDYMVIAGGASGATTADGYGSVTFNPGYGGAGAGGYRAGSGPTALTLTAGSYPVTVGVGGTGGSGSSVAGNPSVLTWSPAPIAATGGGTVGQPDTSAPFAPAAGGSGGSGGGGGSAGPPTSAVSSGGSGNAGGYTPVEGYPGGQGGSPGPGGTGGGGGGGAGGAGYAGGPPTAITPGFQGAGGTGVPNSINGTNVTYAYGGAAYAGPGTIYNTAGSAGTGSANVTPGLPVPTFAGKDGVVIIRYVVV